MNSYDERHLKILRVIAAGNWDALGEADVDEIRTLMVCGYIYLRRLKEDRDVLALRPDGKHYMERLQQLQNNEHDASICSFGAPLPN
ncbi:hypothetical protein [Pseudomonas japonica]|uniref:hypothetical protein n=1 Tax=Pseudomonas japonica TaxID=256466 RepID=UPI0015E3B636|nr:hypothetical protein [Pseudomonas japonica]MBA1290546.1 hypothetical protein [Pseudomonas japonica]